MYDAALMLWRIGTFIVIVIVLLMIMGYKLRALQNEALYFFNSGENNMFQNMTTQRDNHFAKRNMRDLCIVCFMGGAMSLWFLIVIFKIFGVH